MMTQEEFNKLLDDFGIASYMIPIADAALWRPKQDHARDALRSAFAELQRERDAYKQATEHSSEVSKKHIELYSDLQEDYQALRAQLAEAENDAQRLANAPLW